MNQFNKIINQLNGYQTIGYALIRMFLGIALFVRGWILASDPGAVIALVSEEKLHMWYSYITLAHPSWWFIIGRWPFY